MKHRRMLINAILLVVIGLVSWLVVGPILVYVGIGSYTTGWWIFEETHYYLTPLGWAGVILAICGIIIFAIGLALFPIILILEKTKKGSWYASIEQRPSEAFLRQPSQFIFCTNCGTKLTSEANFCSNCGTPVQKK